MIMAKVFHSLAGMKSFLFLWLFLIVVPLAAQDTIPQHPWYVSRMELPEWTGQGPERPIVIAVVDDAFRLSHHQLRPFWACGAEGKPEAAGRERLSEQVCGRDIADGDGDVSPPAGREAKFFHGTYISGVIADLLLRTFGSDAPRYVKILPVKVLSDFAARDYLLRGYEGVRYAMENGADIICCAWNGGGIGAAERALFEEARQKGILILTSAGNDYAERPAPPASLAATIAVAAVDSAMTKTEISNYGMFVDLAGPGRGVVGADATSDSAMRTGGATSAAVAAVTAAVGILRSTKPEATPESLLQALKNAATPLEGFNPSFAGKLGSGFVHVQRALQFLDNPDHCCLPHNVQLPEGSISQEFLPEAADSFEWRIAPSGNFKSIQFDLDPAPNPTSATLRLLDDRRSMLKEWRIDSAAGPFSVPGSGAYVQYHSPEAEKPAFRLHFAVQTVDSSTLYCGPIRYRENLSGEISDGSGEAAYAGESDCRWLITVPQGKRIRLRFTEFNTQSRKDFVYLFDGAYAEPKQIIAKFSGAAIPPEVVSRTNQVLVWFATDRSVEGEGWTLQYQVVE